MPKSKWLLLLLITVPVLLAVLLTSDDAGRIVLYLPAFVRGPLAEWVWHHASPHGVLCNTISLCVSPTVLQTEQYFSDMSSQIMGMRIAVVTVPAERVLQTYVDNIGHVLPKLPSTHVALAADDVDTSLRAIRSSAQHIRTKAQIAGERVNSAITSVGETSGILSLSFSSAQAALKRNHTMKINARDSGGPFYEQLQFVRHTLQEANDKLSKATSAVADLRGEISVILKKIDQGQVALTNMNRQIADAHTNADKSKLGTALAGAVGSAIAGAVGCTVGMLAGPGGCVLAGSFMVMGGVGSTADDIQGIQDAQTTVAVTKSLDQTPNQMKEFLSILESGYEKSQESIDKVQALLRNLDELILKMLSESQSSSLSMFMLDVLINPCVELNKHVFIFNHAYLNSEHVFQSNQIK